MHTSFRMARDAILKSFSEIQSWIPFCYFKIQSREAFLKSNRIQSGTPKV